MEALKKQEGSEPDSRLLHRVSALGAPPPQEPVRLGLSNPHMLPVPESPHEQVGDNPGGSSTSPEKWEEGLKYNQKEGFRPVAVKRLHKALSLPESDTINKELVLKIMELQEKAGSTPTGHIKWETLLLVPWEKDNNVNDSYSDSKKGALRTWIAAQKALDDASNELDVLMFVCGNLGLAVEQSGAGFKNGHWVQEPFVPSADFVRHTFAWQVMYPLGIDVDGRVGSTHLTAMGLPVPTNSYAQLNADNLGPHDEDPALVTLMNEQKDVFWVKCLKTITREGGTKHYGDVTGDEGITMGMAHFTSPEKVRHLFDTMNEGGKMMKFFNERLTEPLTYLKLMNAFGLTSKTENLEDDPSDKAYSKLPEPGEKSELTEQNAILIKMLENDEQFEVLMLWLATQKARDAMDKHFKKVVVKAAVGAVLLPEGAPSGWKTEVKMRTMAVAVAIWNSRPGIVTGAGDARNDGERAYTLDLGKRYIRHEKERDLLKLADSREAYENDIAFPIWKKVFKTPSAANADPIELEGTSSYAIKKLPHKLRRLVLVAKEFQSSWKKPFKGDDIEQKMP